MDAAIREQALDVEQSFIVQAPAGSGKTELLTQRFLALLAHVADTPEAILAMTFTRKAAQEMRQRIMHALKQAKEDAPVQSPHQQQTRDLAKAVLAKDATALWGLLHNPQRLRIQTFDALCAQIARQLPISSRLGTEPRIIEQSESLYHEAACQLLEHLDTRSPFHQPLSQLLKHLDHDVERTLTHLVAMLSRREQWLRLLERDYHDAKKPDDDGLLTYLHASLARVIQSELSQLRAALSSQADISTLLIALWQHAKHYAPVDHPMHQLALEAELPGTTLDDLPRWQALAQWLLTQDGSWRSVRGLRREHGCLPQTDIPAADKARFNKHRTQWQSLLAMLEQAPAAWAASLDRIRKLPSSDYYHRQADKVGVIKMTLRLLAAELERVFALHGHIDFIGMALSALRALGTTEQPTDLAMVMQQQLQALLVDEFQDTSVLQFEMLERLTADWSPGDGRSLFLVGDPMQSIYRFRQAEVGLFLQAQQYGIGAIRLTALTLIHNFRSTEALVSWYNQHFTTIFPAQEDISTGAISYSPAAHTQKNTQTAGVTVQAFLADKPHELPYHAEAAYIAHSLHTLRSQQPEASMAILVRTKAQVAPLLPWLRLYALPYQAHDIDPLHTKPYIQDLLVLLKALAHLGDKLSWLALLRTPFIGLALADLLVLTQCPAATIWEALATADTLSADGQVIVARIMPLLQEALALKHSLPWADLIRGLWLQLGGPLTLPHPEAASDVDTWFVLLAEHAQLGIVYDWHAFELSTTKRFAGGQVLQANPIDIMTIHKSKGLEFDVVFLPGLERIGRQDNHDLLLWYEQANSEGSVDLLLAPIKASGDDADPVYRFIRQQHQRKAQFELARLLYVACTRARQQLYLTANIHAVDIDAVKPNQHSCLSLLWPSLGKTFMASLDVNPNTVAMLHGNTQRQASRLPIAWQQQQVSARAVLTTTSPSATNRRLLQQTLQQDALPRQRGVVMHSLLELLAVTPMDIWASQLDNWVNLGERLLQQAGAPKEQQQANRLWLTQTLTQILHDPRCLWLFDPSHQEAANECAILTHTDKPSLIRIDRTFIDASGTRWIIDYKTACLDAAAIADFWNLTWPQYQQQLQSYVQTLATVSAHPIRVGLYFPCIPHWFEWEDVIDTAADATSTQWAQ